MRKKCPTQLSDHTIRDYTNNNYEQEQDRSNRFNREDNREYNRSCSREFVSYANEQSIISYFTNALLIFNSKSMYLQDIAIIKQKAFKLLEIKYFYFELSKNTYAIENYIIFEKDVFYCDVYMFTQQIRRVIATKKINKQFYLCLREFTII